jgi:hypothetical protein
MSDCAMLDTIGSPLVVKPRVKTAEFWVSYSIGLLLVLLFLVLVVALLGGTRNNRICMGTIAVVLIPLDVLLVFLKYGDGAMANTEGLVLTHVLLSRRRREIAWPNVESVKVKVFPGRKWRLMRWVSIIFLDEGAKRVTRCAYDLTLLRVIVSCAGLTLDETVDNEQIRGENIKDPFEAIRRGRPRKQTWSWSRS